MCKKDLIEHLRQRLASDPRWALRALIRIYQNQTADEQAHNATIERNGIGFSGPDAEILSSFARQILQCSDAARLETAFSGNSHTQSADS